MRAVPPCANLSLGSSFSVSLSLAVLPHLSLFILVECTHIEPGLTTSRRMRGCISRRRRGVFLFVASIGTIELPVTWSFQLPRGPSKVPKNPAREGRKNSVCCNKHTPKQNTLLSLSVRGLTTMTRTSVVYSNAYGIIYMSVDVHNFQAILSSGISLKGPSFFISDRVEHPPLRSARFSLVIILIIIRMNF